MCPENSENEVAIESSDLTIGYASRTVMTGLNLRINRKSIVAIIAPNGTGKTTLLLTIAGIFPTLSGELHVTDPHNVGFVLQDPQNQIVGNTVEEDIAFGLENKRTPKEDIDRTIATVLDYFGIAHLRKADPSTLSAGQSQLLALSSAWALSPGLMLLDEPFSMIDRDHRSKIIAVVKKMRKSGTTAVVAVSRLFDTLWTDRVIALGNTGILFDGKPQDLIGQYEKLFGQTCVPLGFFTLMREC